MVTLSGCYCGAALYGLLVPALKGIVFSKEVDGKKPGSWYACIIIAAGNEFIHRIHAAELHKRLKFNSILA